jgi:membrane protein EpsK
MAASAADSVRSPRLDAGQFGKNVVLTCAAVGANLVTGFLLAPFLIQSLGVEGYGIVPLTYTLVNYMSVVNIALNAAVSRNVALAITAGDHSRASSIFNTSLWASVAAGAGLILLGIAASVSTEALVNVPSRFLADARILFVTASINVVLVLISAPLSTGLYYANRLDTKAAADLSSRIVYAALAFGLIQAVSPRPAMIGVALLGSGVVGWCLIAASWRRFTPWLTVRFHFSGREFLDLMSFGGWSVVAHAGNMLFLSIDLIIVNRFLGPRDAGMYAALLQWPGIIRMFSITISSVLSQPMAHLFAKHGLDALLRHALRVTRYVAFLTVMPVVVVGGLAHPLIRLWLGPEIAERTPLLLLLVWHLGVTMSAIPLVTALQTIRQVRAVGIATCAAAGMNVVLAVVLVQITDLGSYAVAGAGAFAYVILTVVFVPYQLARGFPNAVRPVLANFGAASVVSAFGMIVAYAMEQGCAVVGWIELCASAAAVTIGTGAAGWWLVLHPDDRSKAVDAVVAIVRRALRSVRP